MGQSEKKLIDYLEYLREEKDLTKSEFANKIGVSLRTYRRWTNGQRIPNPELYWQAVEHMRKLRPKQMQLLGGVGQVAFTSKENTSTLLKPFEPDYFWVERSFNELLHGYRLDPLPEKNYKDKGDSGPFRDSLDERELEFYWPTNSDLLFEFWREKHKKRNPEIRNFLALSFLRISFQLLNFCVSCDTVSRNLRNYGQGTGWSSFHGDVETDSEPEVHFDGTDYWRFQFEVNTEGENWLWLKKNGGLLEPITVEEL